MSAQRDGDAPAVDTPADEIMMRRYVVLEALQKVAAEIRNLTDRLESSREQQRALIIEAVDELGVRLPMVASVLGISPQRVHSLKQEALTRAERQQALGALERQVADLARELDANVAEILDRAVPKKPSRPKRP